MIEIKKINIRYKNDIIKDSCLKLSDLGIVLLNGESGCGKTSLIRNILYEENQFEEYIYNSTTITSKDEISHLFSIMNQNNHFIEDLTIQEHFQLIQKIFQSKNIDKYIEKLEIIHILDKYPNQLSGGEKNRINFLFCLAKSTSIIVLDEPTASLDSYFTKIIKDIIYKESKDHLFIIASHDPEFLDIANTIYKIKNKKIICIKCNEIHTNKNDSRFTPKMNLYSFFLKMKKHRLFYNTIMVILISLSISITSLALGYSFSNNNKHYDDLNSLINKEIIIYKPIMTQNKYFFSADGLETPINKEEIQLINKISGVVEIIPHIELNLTGTHESFENRDLGIKNNQTITILKNNEIVNSIEDFPSIITLVNYDEVIEKEIEIKYQNEGIYLSKELAETLKIDEYGDYELSFYLPIPQYNIIGDGEFSYMDSELYPVNWVQCSYLPTKIKVAGVLKGNSLCQWSSYSTNAMFISHDSYENLINQYKKTDSKTYYFDKNLFKYTLQQNEDSIITNICFSEPWIPNAYKIKIDKTENYSSILNEIKELGFSTLSINDVNTLDKIAYQTSLTFQLISSAITIILIIINSVIKFINIYQNNSFIKFSLDLNYNLKQIKLLLIEKYTLDTLITVGISLLFLFVLQTISITVNYVIAPITYSTIIIIIGLSYLIEFIIPFIIGGFHYDRIK